MVIQNPVGAQERSKQLQYYEQPAFRTQGVDPPYKNVGINTSYTPNFTVQHKETRVVGSRLLYSDRKLMEEGTLEVVYEMLDTVLPNYGIKQPAGTGTIAFPLSFLETVTFPGGTTKYRQFNDCMTETVTLEFVKDFVITQTFYSADITDFKTEAELKTALGVTGTGTIDYAPALSGEAWNHLDSTMNNTSSPMSINGDPFLIEAITVEVNNNLRKQNPMGYSQTRYISPGNFVLTGTLTTYLTEAQDMINHVRNFDSNALSLKVKEATTPGDVFMNLTGVKFNAFSDTVEAGSNDWSLMELPFTASNVTLTNYP